MRNGRRIVFYNLNPWEQPALSMRVRGRSRDKGRDILNKIVFSITLILISILLSGCLYSHVTVPLSTDLNKTELGNKKGEASIHSVIWLFAWGDAGGAAAAKNGGITTMTHMDRELYVILFGIYTRTTTIVYGN
jgi:hypothetical protein